MFCLLIIGCVGNIIWRKSAFFPEAFRHDSKCNDAANYVFGSFAVGFVFVTAIVIVAGLIGSVLSYVLRRGTRESAIRNICFFIVGIDKELSVPQRSFLN